MPSGSKKKIGMKRKTRESRGQEREPGIVTLPGRPEDEKQVYLPEGNGPGEPSNKSFMFMTFT